MLSILGDNELAGHGLNLGIDNYDVASFKFWLHRVANYF
ncbi:hypothetical protein SeSB_A0803 [Salmonella enterica subsp. enterica serovar Schwarzengrund str. SL480]|uniref:Uncharacterized protein n=2 Tax=Salmonella enterica I TaxID=59201 RepID=A0A0N1TUK4_SALSV|nr:hypothetical protein SeSA_A0616 [Salmonella enterica subsp. enterica serovar Schwarzengrund str. CVM19633]ACN45443.1 hypothetical protein SPC_1280 [Salmonella enterica subsp. enterica serovar Paratyphi C str. RKS4594]EDY27549.1 hypothetical protein SeSB_A0803 [Salmonella enterica subsp. enterica serovar Schwarzengrund str. SL480]